jgi:ABC-type sugar transport system substrate-binding protein
MNRLTPTRYLSAALALLLGASFFMGCGTAHDRATGGRTLPADALIALIGPPATDAKSAAICGGAQRYAARYPNVHCLTIAPPDAEPASFTTAVDEALGQQPLAICLYLKDPHIEQVIERIREKSIVLVTIGLPLKNAAVYGQVEVGLPEAAEILANNLKSLLPPAVNSYGHERRERSYALFHADGRDQSASDTYARFIATLRDQPDLACLEQINTSSSGRTPQQLIAGTLGRFSTVELIVTLDPEPWLLLHPRLHLPARNHFATLGAAPRLWPRLQSGEALALVGPLDGEIGYAAMELAAQGLMAIPDAPTRRTIHCELVTKANLDDFARRYAAAANLDPRDLLPFGRTTQP